MASRTKGSLRYDVLTAAVFSLTVIFRFIEAIDYTGYKLYQLTADTPAKNELLQSLEGIPGYDIWTHLRGNASQIMVPPQLQAHFESLMDDAAIKKIVIIEDMAVSIEKDKQQRQSFESRRNGGHNTVDPNKFKFDRFLRYKEIVKYMGRISRNKEYTRMIVIGTTYEGRPIVGLRIRASKNNPVIFIDGGIHAREWAAPMTALYLVKKIVQNEESFARNVTIYIVPCVNPDGYEYTHTTDRLWRKTRSKITLSECRGVDLNRNFDSHWAEMGADLMPCSETFAGYGPFTEPESRALRDAILATKPVMYLTFHSYGAFMLYPWGFTSSLPPNWQELHMLAHKAAAAIQRVHGTEYIIGSSTNVLYAASGGSDDWAMEKAGVPLVYTMELPDYGQAFRLPADKIRPVVTETYQAFLVFANYVITNYDHRHN